MTPGELADRIVRDLARLPDRVGHALADTGRDVRDTEQTVTHKVTGRLAASETVFGPTEVVGAIEVTIEPVGVPYAELEAARGGSHNFAERGLEASAAHLETLRRNLERVLITIIEG